MLLVPNCSTWSTTDWRKPFSTEATVTTSSTPMKMPSAVRNERKRCASSVSNASRKFSTAISRKVFIGSLRPQGLDRVEARRAPRRVDAEEDADRGADDERGERRPGREPGRQRRVGGEQRRRRPGDGDADRAAEAGQQHRFVICTAI